MYSWDAWFMYFHSAYGASKKKLIKLIWVYWHFVTAPVLIDAQYSSSLQNKILYYLQKSLSQVKLYCHCTACEHIE